MEGSDAALWISSPESPDWTNERAIPVIVATSFLYCIGMEESSGGDMT